MNFNAFGEVIDLPIPALTDPGAAAGRIGVASSAPLAVPAGAAMLHVCVGEEMVGAIAPGASLEVPAV